MFVLTTAYSNIRFVAKDASSLESRLLSITRNESEAKRIAAIASNMKFGDSFTNLDIYLKCKESTSDDR